MAKFRQIAGSLEHGETDAKVLLDRLAASFPPDVIVANIEKLLNATIPMKHGDRPDPNAIGVAIRLLLAYRVGEPIKRIAHADVSRKESDDETQERIAQSPAALRAMAAALAESPDGRAAIEAALAPRKKGKAEIVEAEPES